ncbi:MAG: RusA family crossover junction endodeoxyribonuclease, partial [Acetobacteraceae bacterium]|nr:RusA family crossover junction endodeoxyribonuclease [Acetobacteraceae bacterium]
MRFTVYGHPRPKQRPRMAVSFRGRRMVARVYTPPETKRWEEHVRAAALAAGARPLDGPVEVEARVWVAGRRGDGDNLWKALA